MTDAPRLVNLTGHPLHLYAGGRKVRTIDSDVPGLRIAQDEMGAHEVDGIEVMSFAYRPGNLPAPQPGTWYIVSQVAALALIATGVRRPDILIPGPGVSDRGRVVGCRGLRWLVAPRTGGVRT